MVHGKKILAIDFSNSFEFLRQQLIITESNTIKMKIIGIDLAGKTDNPTGICVLDTNKSKQYAITLFTLYSDEDILDKINSVQPSLIVIDAPPIIT